MHKGCACVQEPEAVNVPPGIVQLPGRPRVQHRHDTCAVVYSGSSYTLYLG